MLVTPADSRNLDKVLKLIGKAPAEETLNIDWSQASTDKRPKGDRDKRPSRDRDERSRGRRVGDLGGVDGASGPDGIRARAGSSARRGRGRHRCPGR